MKGIRTSAMAVSRKLRAATDIIRHCKNWYEVVPLVAMRKSPTRIDLRCGIVLEAPRSCALYARVKEVFMQGVYTPPALDIEPHDVVVDIGAYVGCFVLFAAGKTERKIYAFEPFPRNVERLKKNLEANPRRSVCVGCFAVSDRCGKAKLYLGDSDSGHLLFPRNIKGELDRYLEVSAVTLESIMRDYSISRIGFLKMDCEGAEGQILKSAPADCLGKVDKIALEFHDNVSVLGHTEIVDLLERRGFSCSLDWDGASPFGYIHARRN